MIHIIMIIANTTMVKMMMVINISSPSSVCPSRWWKGCSMMRMTIVIMAMIKLLMMKISSLLSPVCPSRWWRGSLFPAKKHPHCIDGPQNRPSMVTTMTMTMTMTLTLMIDHNHDYDGDDMRPPAPPLSASRIESPARSA